MACCKACCGCADCSEGGQGKCCCGGAEGACCDVGEYCCDGECVPGPCCTVDEDCLFCDEGFKLVGGASAISEDLKCCDESAVGWVDDIVDGRFGNCVSNTDPGTVENNFYIVPGDPVNEGYCCDGACSEEECPPP